MRRGRRAPRAGCGSLRGRHAHVPRSPGARPPRGARAGPRCAAAAAHPLRHRIARAVRVRRGDRGAAGLPGGAPRRPRRRDHAGRARPGLVAGHPYVPEGFDFAGRPQLVARFPGTGGGPTLLLNGHVDVVRPTRASWTPTRSAAEVAMAASRPGRLRHEGRDRCDGGRRRKRCASSAYPLARRRDGQYGERGGVHGRGRAVQGEDTACRRGDRPRADGADTVTGVAASCSRR